MKVCLVCVCYNAYIDAKKLLDSLDAAHQNSAGLALTVVFSDNSTNPSDRDELDGDSYSFDYIYCKNKNIGYFPAFRAGLLATGVLPDTFDYVIVSNVDLTVDSSFFVQLKAASVPAGVGVIGPSIRSLSHGGDLNPKILHRPEREKLARMRTICSNHLVFFAHRLLSAARDNLRSKINADRGRAGSNGEMYAAHGAFMIFTKEYFLRGGAIEYPVFLFGEEVFVAEEARRLALRTVHIQALAVYDRGHGSTSLMASKLIAGEYRRSYDYLLDNYFDRNGSCSQ